MKFLLICVATLILSAQSFAVDVKSGDLRELIETKNERVAAKAKEKEAAKYREGFLLRSYLPQVQLYGAQESFKKGRAAKKTQPNFGIEASFNLFNGGKDYLEESKRTLTSQRKSFEREVVLADELNQARETYWKILFLKEKFQLLTEARSKNTLNLKSAGRRVRSGVATEIDRVEFEMKDIDLKRELAIVELDISSQEKSLSVILGFDPGTKLNFSEPLDHEHKWEDSLVHDHDEHDFIVKPKTIFAEEVATDAAIYSRSIFPKVDAFIGWTQFNEREEQFADPKDRRESVVGFRLTMDLSDGIESHRNAAALRAESSAIFAEANYQKREIEIHIHNELAELKLLHAQVHAAEENIKRAQRYYSLTMTEYARGVKNSPDVLGATEKLYETKEKHLAIIRDFQIAKSHVLSKIGK